MTFFKSLRTITEYLKLPPQWAILSAAGLIIAFTFQNCVDPVKPVYDFRENIIFIDAYAVTQEGQSYVNINRSIINDGRSEMEGLEGATIKYHNTVSETDVVFIEEGRGIYTCPADFAVKTGESWKLSVELADGRRYESAPETVTTSVPINEISAYYAKELVYDEGYKKFVPGHAVSIDFTDPAGEENYYLWKYRSFEALDICFTCYRGKLRGGVCEELSTPWGPPYYDYLCKTSCWMIRYGKELKIFDDRLSDGANQSSFHIADILFYRRQNLLVEIQQMSLTRSGYNYFKVVNDILNESSGLNAPPPAALYGNLFNPDDPDDLVLGQFTATAVSTKRVYIDRSDITEAPLDPDHVIRLEPCNICPDSIRYYPCVEGFYRTGVKPEGWP